MHKTPFSGLTEMDPGDNFGDANSSFFTRNPDIIDHFLEIGAVTHRHDAHPALGNPLRQPSASISSSGGSIGANVGIYLGYTLVDPDGGETTISPLTTLVTTPPYDPPDDPIRGTVTYTSGALLADTYYYALTLTDGQGGETLIGPVLSIDRQPGPAFASITLDGLTGDFPDNNSQAWRLYRARSGEQLGFLASGNTDRFVDAGQGCVDCGQPPPTSNRTNQGQAIAIIVPGSAGFASGSGGVGSGAASFRLYGSLDGTFEGNALLGQFPPASAGTVMTFRSLAFLEGGPPAVPTAVRGASLIDAETLANLFWRSAVTSSGALPNSQRIGEVRLALDSGLVYGALGASGGQAGGQGWVEVGSAWRASAGTMKNVAASGDGNAANISGIVFAASGEVSIGVAPGVGGSAVVTISAPFPSGASGPGSVAIGGSGRSPLFPARSYIEFAGSGGAAVALTDLGGGSAQVLIAGERGPAGPTGASAVGLVSRAVTSAALNLTSGASGALGLILGSAYRVYAINADRAARLELYANSAYQAADQGRAVGTDPTGNHGVMLDFFVPDTKVWAMSPLVDGASLEVPPQTSIPVVLTNRGADGVVTVALTYARTE